MVAKLGDRGRVYALFAIVTFACAAGSLTQTVMNSMLGGIEADFGISTATGQWLTTIYMLVLGIVVPAVTYLSRKLSTRNLVYLMLAFFFAGSVVAMVAPSFEALMAGRVLQAISTGISLPLVQFIAMTRFPAGQNATAMGIAGIAMGFAPNIGPLIGGALVDTWGWRSFFILALAAIALLGAATTFLVEKDRAPHGEASFDVASFALSTFGFGGLLLAFSNASTEGLASALVWVPAAVGVACLTAFVMRQKRISQPLINLCIFRSQRFRASFVMQNCLFASFMGITLAIPLLVQGPMGLTALEAGMVFVPATVVALVANPLAGYLSDTLGHRPVIVGASVCLFAGAASMAFVGASTPLAALAVMQALRGLGVSSLVGPLASWGLSELAPNVTMDGSAFFTTVRQACASLGTAVMVLAITWFGAQGHEVLGYQVAFGVSAALSLVVLVVALAKAR